MPGTDEVVGRGLGGRVGARRVVGRVFGEVPLGAQGTEDLVGADVVKAHVGPFCPPRRAASSRLAVPRDVGLDEVQGPVDRSVDVALGGEVHHRVDVVFGEDRLHRCSIANVGALEDVTGAESGLDVAQASEVAGVGQGVEVDETDTGVGLPAGGGRNCSR